MKTQKRWIGRFWNRSSLKPANDEQSNQQHDLSFTRALIDAQKIDTEQRTVEVAFSSEQPVERAFGYEVLDHTPGAMRTQRLEDGAALLLDHDWRNQIGVVESMRIDDDGKARAKVRFSKSARADEIFQDVQDGIRKHISVGYRIHDMKETGKREGIPMMRVTDWEPYEISIVSVPADPSVGVGRSIEKPPEEKGDSVRDTDHHLMNRSEPSKESEPMNEKILRNAKGDLVRAKVDDQGNILEEIEIIESAEAQRKFGESLLKQDRERVNDIRTLAKRFDCEELGERFLREVESGTLDEFESWIKRHGQTTATDMRTMLNGRPSSSSSNVPNGIGLTEREAGQFSFMKAIRAMASPNDKRAQEAAAFEYDVSVAAQKQMGREANGILIPNDVLGRNLTAAGSGSQTIATDLLASSFIKMLKNKALMMQLCHTMGGMVGNVDIPKQTAASQGYWIGEDEDATETDIDFGQIKLNPKTVAAFSEVTRALLQQSSLDVEALIRQDLATALALTMDLAALYGKGSDNEPLGILNTTGINVVDIAAAGKPTYEEAVAMESMIASENADVEGMRYLMNTLMRGHFKTTQKFKGTNGVPVWEPGDTVNGYSTGVTNQMKPNDLLFGNFKDVIIAMWGGLDLTVDPYSHSKKGRLRVVVFQDMDCVVRRTESFCLGRTPANG